MIQAIGGIACVLLAPIIQACYAILARHRIIPSSTLLITLAFILCGVTLGYSSGIQHLIYVSPPCYNRPLECLGGGVPNRVSVWLQVPMYFIAVTITCHALSAPLLTTLLEGHRRDIRIRHSLRDCLHAVTQGSKSRSSSLVSTGCFSGQRAWVSY